MAAAAGAGWQLPGWVTAAALATAAAVVAATACWLALCRLAAWRRRGARVAGDFPPDPPTGARKPRPNDPEVPPGISCPKPQSCTTASSLVAPISITLTGEQGGPKQGARHPPPFSVPVGEEEEPPAVVEMNH